MEGGLDPAFACMNVASGFIETEREAMRATLLAHTCLYLLLPRFDILYIWTKESDGYVPARELFAALTHIIGVRQDWVILGTFVLC
jgi:hypothetical protein